jgi:hypothetical protein
MDPVSNGVRPGIGHWLMFPAMLLAMLVTTVLFGIGSDRFRPFLYRPRASISTGGAESWLIFSEKTL